MAIQLLEKIEKNENVAVIDRQSDRDIALANPTTDIITEKRFTLPGYYAWEQFLVLNDLRNEHPSLRITYLDGSIELMAAGEEHERISRILGILLAVYFFEKGIKFIPLGSATTQDENKTVSLQPDESYCLWEKKTSPDLAIEIIMTSGTIKKLEKYRRVNVQEVWFWQNEQLSLYHLRESGYEQIVSSELLPDLDIELLVKCVQMSDILEARTELLKGLGLS